MQALIGSSLMAAAGHIQMAGVGLAVRLGKATPFKDWRSNEEMGVHAQLGVSEGGSLTMRYWRSALLDSRSRSLCRRALCSAHRAFRACAVGACSERIFSAPSTVHGIICPKCEPMFYRSHSNERLHAYGHDQGGRRSSDHEHAL